MDIIRRSPKWTGAGAVRATAWAQRAFGRVAGLARAERWRSRFLISTCALLCWSQVSSVRAAEYWLAPPDDIAQAGADFQDFFARPELWRRAAGNVTTFSMTAQYLTRAQPDLVQKELTALSAAHIKLAVSISALPVDKKQCGDGLEGMTWPGEATSAAQKIKALGANVDYFDFDLPLTMGSEATMKNACRLSIAESAQRLASAAREFRRVYPDVKFTDSEVPTGMPAEKWAADLVQWLQAYRTAFGEDLDGVNMDVWWKAQWVDTVRKTSEILQARGMRSGIFIDASEGPSLSPQDWLNAAKSNACALLATETPIDRIIVANWLNMRVKSLPESDPLTLTSLFDWMAAKPKCAAP